MYTKLYPAHCPKSILIGLLIIAGGAACAPIPAQAQLNAEFGIQIGRTSATVNGEGDWSNAKRRSGWMLAGTARVPLARRLTLQYDVAYVQKGARETISTAEGPITVTMKTDYIELPVVVGRKWSPNSTVTARGFAGPAVGFNVAAELESERPLPNQSNLRDQVRRTAFSAVLGLGVDFHINYQTITMDAQYQLGLTEVLDASDTNSFQHRGVSVAMGVMF